MNRVLLYVIGTIVLVYCYFPGITRYIWSQNDNNAEDRKILQRMSSKCNWDAIMKFGNNISFFIKQCPNKEASFNRNVFHVSIMGETILKRPAQALEVYRARPGLAVPDLKWNALHMLGYTLENPHVIKQFVAAFPGMLTERDKYGRTPLENAMHCHRSSYGLGKQDEAVEAFVK